MGIFEDNLGIIARASVQTAQRIAVAQPHPGVVFSEARDGSLTATLDGRQLCSRYDPRAEADRFSGACGVEDNPCTVVAGFGLGYHVSSLAKRATRRSVVVCYEPDLSLLRSALERVDLSLTSKDAGLLLVTDADDPELGGHFLRLRNIVPVGIRYMVHPSAMARLKEHLAAFVERLIHLVGITQTSLSNDILLAPVCLRNALRNVGVYAGGWANA